MNRGTSFVRFILLFLFASLNQIKTTKGDNINVKLAIDVPWQSTYLIPTNPATQQLATNLKATAASIYSSYPDPVRVEMTSFYQFNRTQTGVTVQISSNEAWNDTIRSKVVYFLSNYLHSNNRQIEVSGQVYAVTDGLHYVASTGQVFVDDLCFLFDGENLCKNGGTCKVDSEEPVCRCTSSFVGEFCTISTVSGGTTSTLSVTIIILICSAAVLVVLVIAAWLGCRSSKKEQVGHSVPAKKGDPTVLASSDSIQSGGAPQVIAFPVANDVVYLTESDQNLMQKEGPKVLKHLFQKHIGRKNHKTSDAGTKTKGSVYKKKNEQINGTTNIMVGSGEYQHSIGQTEVDTNYESRQPTAAVGSNWQFRQSDETDNDSRGYDDNTLRSQPPVQLQDQYEGSQTRVTVTDPDHPTTLPPITEVDGSGNFDDYPRYTGNTDFGY